MINVYNERFGYDNLEHYEDFQFLSYLAKAVDV